MKKIAAVCLGTLLAVSLTGCGDKVKLTTEQNDMIAEYISGVMLKYSYDNQWDYQKLRTAQNTYNSKGSISDTNTATQSGTTAANNTTVATASNAATKKGAAKVPVTSTGDVYSDMKRAFELPSGAGLSYTTYTVGDRYPTTEFAISVPASEGCKVVAVEFTIKNDTASDIVVNTGASGINFRLSANGTTIKQLNSMLRNDISALSNVSIPSGSGYTAVAVFQVADSVAENLSNMSLEVYENTVSLGTIPVASK